MDKLLVAEWLTQPKAKKQQRSVKCLPWSQAGIARHSPVPRSSSRCIRGQTHVQGRVASGRDSRERRAETRNGEAKEGVGFQEKDEAWAVLRCVYCRVAFFFVER